MPTHHRLYATALSCFVLLHCACLHAQTIDPGTITGVVVDESNNDPIPFVNVVLHTASDSTIITGSVTDKDGKVSMPNIPEGRYFVGYSLIGYREKSSPVFVIDATHKHLNLGTVALTATTVDLDEVLVTGEKSIFSNSIDRKVYNVDQDLRSSSGSASELLQNVPSVQVDIDGNVSLRGSSNVLIMLNGRTSPLMKRNSAEVLQQMPASSIERIEVITNPSAKYKPEGTSGILNIVLKKERTLGLNGSVGANAGNQDRYNSSVRLNYNPGRWNVFGSYSIRKDNRNRNNTDHRSLTDSITAAQSLYDNHLDSYARPLSHMVALGCEYQIDEQNRLGVSGNYFYNSFTRTDFSNNILRSFDGTQLLNQYDRNRLDYETEGEQEFKAFVEHTFPKKDHTLRLEFTRSRAPETEDNRYTNRYTEPLLPNSYDNALIKNTETSNQLTLEYSNPLSKTSQLEAGYEGEFNSIDYDYRIENFDPLQQRFVTDFGKTSRFLHDENINTAYATYQQSLGTFGFKAGLRVEHASVPSNLVTLDSSITNSYVSVYPSLHLSYRLSPLSELQVSYSRRTRRPESEDLNPFPEYRDPRNIRAGNPKLLPEYVHSLELGYQFETDELSLLPALFYRYTYNRFTAVTHFINDTLLLTTHENLSNDQAGGVEMIASVNAGEWLIANWNASAFVNQIDATNLGYGDKKSVTTWSSTLTIDLNVTPSTRMQINTHYRSKRLTPQGEMSPSYGVNLGVRQKLWDDRLSVISTVTDLFRTMKRQYDLTTPLVNQTTVGKRDARIVYLGFIYQFGEQPKKSKEDQLHYDDAM